MKAGLYCRVSTDTQSEGYSIDAQKELLAAYCKAREIDAFTYYVDGGFSGSNIERPMMRRLIDDCAAKKVDIVIVYKLDRLSRSQKDTLFLIEEIFIPNGVDFISVSENFDTSTPLGKAMIGILSVFAQLEREMIKERTRMGMRERVKGGRWPGGGKTPYGYSYDRKSGILVPNANAPIVRKAYELYIAGLSAEAIALRLGLKYDKLVMQILQSKINCGLIEFKGETHKGLHEPLVSVETYEAAMARMEQRRRRNARATPHLLTGLVRCGVCGAKMRYQKWGKAGDKICCYSQQSSKPYMIRDRNCTNSKFWAWEVEEAVIGQLSQFSLNPALLEERMSLQGAEKSQEVKKSLADVERRISNLISFIAEGIAVDETREKLASLTEQKAALARLAGEAGAKRTKADSFRKKVRVIADVWEDLAFEEKCAVLHSLIETVTLTPGTVSILYSFDL